MRKAFSLLTAIVVMVMMASISLLVLNTAGKVNNETLGQYRQEQSMLLAKSYTEFAILAIQENELNVTIGCLETITANIDNFDANGIANLNGVEKGEGYKVEVVLQYIGLPTPCPLNSLAGTTSNDVSVLIDVFVRYHDLSVVDALGGSASDTDPWVTYHRRTLQKL